MIAKNRKKQIVVIILIDFTHKRLGVMERYSYKNMRFKMRKITLKQGGIVSFFIDGLVSLALIIPWLKYMLDQLVDYYRHLLLHGKKLHCPRCLSLYVVKYGKKKAGTFGIIDTHTRLISIESFDFNLANKANMERWMECI